MIHIGFGSMILKERVVAILQPYGKKDGSEGRGSWSEQMKKVKNDAKVRNQLVNVCHGRKVRSMILTDSNQIILTAINPDTLRKRFDEGGIRQIRYKEFKK